MREMQWKAYVQFQDKEVKIEKFIKKVRFSLHPDYGSTKYDAVKVENGQFCTNQKGYTTFSMQMHIYWQQGTGIKGVEKVRLSKFDKDGVKKVHFVKINKKKY